MPRMLGEKKLLMSLAPLSSPSHIVAAVTHELGLTHDFLLYLSQFAFLKGQSGESLTSRNPHGFGNSFEKNIDSPRLTFRLYISCLYRAG